MCHDGLSGRLALLQQRSSVYAFWYWCLFTGAHRRPGTMACILPDPQLFLFTSLKVNDLWVSININSVMQDAWQTNCVYTLLGVVGIQRNFHQNLPICPEQKCGYEWLIFGSGKTHHYRLHKPEAIPIIFHQNNQNGFCGSQHGSKGKLVFRILTGTSIWNMH